MTQENFPEPEHEGDKYLRLLDLEGIAHEPIPGRPELLMRDFLEVCGDQARPMLEGFARLKPTDPRRGAAKAILRREVTKFAGIPIEE